jgi:hypothetical protein
MRNCFGRVLLAFSVALSVPVARAESALLQQVRANYAVLSQATADFDTSRASGALSDTEAADFIDWINHLITQVLVGCQDLAGESAEPVPADLPCSEILGSRPSSADIDTSSERTVEEQTKGLVEQLHAALGKFDEELLQEQEKIKAQMPRSDARGASGSGDAEGSAVESAEEYAGYPADSEADQKGAESADGEEYDAASDAQVTEEDGQEIDGEGQRQTASSSAGTVGSTGQNLPSSAPDDIPGGSDDDVVARQIREAAEKETDPELKEKLWEEYRRYKAGTG